jgi:hypothetical protein
VGVVARLLLKYRTLDWDELSEILESNDEREAEETFGGMRRSRRMVTGREVTGGS